MFDALSTRLQDALGDLGRRSRLDEETVARATREIRLALLEADVDFEVVKQFVGSVRERALGQDVLKGLEPGQQVVKIVHEELTELMGSSDSKLVFGRPPVVHFAETGLLGPNTVFTHMNALDEAEAEAVIGSGMTVVWHPGNAMYYGIARATENRMPALHRGGASLTFGTDVAKVWAFGELGFIAYLLTREGGDYLSSDDLLTMYTRGGEAWRSWYSRVRDHLLESSVTGLGPKGPETSWRARYVGDAFSTAIAAIILQTPKHYLPIFQR